MQCKHYILREGDRSRLGKNIYMYVYAKKRERRRRQRRKAIAGSSAWTHPSSHKSGAAVTAACQPCPCNVIERG
jgi:hypothetical protein